MITLVVGAQYGGEGRGKIAGFLATRCKYDLLIRTGSINSKHTVYDSFGLQHDLRQVPSAAVFNKHTKIYFGAGSMIHFDTLSVELEQLNINKKNV